MSIQQIDVYLVDLRLKEAFTIAIPASAENRNLIIETAKWVLHKTPLKYIRRAKNHDVVVKITTDYGETGWGTSSPPKMVTGETKNTVVATLDKIGPRLVGKCPFEIEQNVESMDSIVRGNPAAKASIDMALHDLLGKKAGQPLYMLLGGYRTEVLTDKTLGIKSPKEMAKDAIGAVNEGFKVIRAKVGANTTDDVERVKLIRKAVGDEVPLRIDANQGWTRQQAIEALNRMAKYNIQFAEQPVPAGDLKGLREVKENSPILIMADESVHSPQDALRLIQAEAADLINIKLMKSGGILKAKKIATIAEGARVPCMMGCGTESEIGITAGAHLAAAVRNIQYANLCGDLLLRDKLVKKGGKALRNSMLLLPRQNGLGIEQLDEKLLGRQLRIYR